MSHQVSCPNCHECLGPNAREIEFYASCSNCGENFKNPEGYHTAKCEHCGDLFDVDENRGTQYEPMCSDECDKASSNPENPGYKIGE